MTQIPEQTSATTHARTHVTRICQSWLVYMWDMTHLHMRHDSFTCETWLIHMWDTMYAHTRNTHCKTHLHAWSASHTTHGSTPRQKQRYNTRCALCKTHLRVSLHLSTYPAAPINHVKIFKGWPPRQAPSKLVQLWYKHFHQTIVVRWKWKPQLDGVIKPVPHDLVRRIRFWR